MNLDTLKRIGVVKVDFTTIFYLCAKMSRYRWIRMWNVKNHTVTWNYFTVVSKPTPRYRCPRYRWISLPLGKFLELYLEKWRLSLIHI